LLVIPTAYAPITEYYARKGIKVLKVKIFTCVITHHGMGMYVLMVAQLHAFLNMVIDDCVSPASHSSLVGQVQVIGSRGTPYSVDEHLSSFHSRAGWPYSSNMYF
jgi:hypothetical protein